MGWQDGCLGSSGLRRSVARVFSLVLLGDLIGGGLVWTGLV